MRTPVLLESWWKRTVLRLTALYSLTGTVTRPKLIAPVQIERGMAIYYHVGEIPPPAARSRACSGGGRLLRGGAEGALSRLARDLGQALAAGPRLGLDVAPGLAPLHQRVDGLDDEEEDGGCDREEGDQHVDEVAVGEGAAVDREHQVGEVGLADDRGDDRRDQVAY